MPAFPRLIIFDCDGVLVDSEPLNIRVLVGMAREFGATMPIAEAVTRFRGRKLIDCVTELAATASRPFPPDFLDQARERAEEAFRRELQPIPGVIEALDRITAPVCVASNGPLAKMAVTLSVTGLAARFEGRLFSAYEIGRWKPDPALYLHAAAACGCAPGECLVVEDSVPGVQAARTAGMRVLAYAPVPSAAEAQELRACGATTFASMTELPDLIRSVVPPHDPVSPASSDSPSDLVTP